MTIAADNLPMPHLVGSADETPVLRTAAGAMPWVRVPDSQVDPRRLRLAWQEVPAAVADAIRRHFAAHWSASWALTLPRSGEVVVVTWAAPPSIQWINSAFANVTGEVLETLAHAL